MTPPDSRPAGDPNSAENTGARSGLAQWQKVVGFIGLVVVMVLAILLATGEHGPGRHAPGERQEQPANGEQASGHDASRFGSLMGATATTVHDRQV